MVCGFQLQLFAQQHLARKRREMDGSFHGLLSGLPVPLGSNLILSLQSQSRVAKSVLLTLANLVTCGFDLFGEVCVEVLVGGSQFWAKNKASCVFKCCCLKFGSMSCSVDFVCQVGSSEVHVPRQQASLGCGLQQALATMGPFGRCSFGGDVAVCWRRLGLREAKRKPPNLCDTSETPQRLRRAWPVTRGLNGRVPALEKLLKAVVLDSAPGEWSGVRWVFS